MTRNCRSFCCCFCVPIPPFCVHVCMYQYHHFIQKEPRGGLEGGAAVAIRNVVPHILPITNNKFEKLRTKSDHLHSLALIVIQSNEKKRQNVKSEKGRTGTERRRLEGRRFLLGSGSGAQSKTINQLWRSPPVSLWSLTCTNATICC